MESQMESQTESPPPAKVELANTAQRCYDLCKGATNDKVNFNPIPTNLDLSHNMTLEAAAKAVVEQMTARDNGQEGYIYRVLPKPAGTTSKSFIGMFRRHRDTERDTEVRSSLVITVEKKVPHWKGPRQVASSWGRKGAEANRTEIFWSEDLPQQDENSPWKVTMMSWLNEYVDLFTFLEATKEEAKGDDSEEKVQARKLELQELALRVLQVYSNCFANQGGVRVLHHDIHNGNILVKRDSQHGLLVFLIDWGMAEAMTALTMRQFTKEFRPKLGNRNLYNPTVYSCFDKISMRQALVYGPNDWGMGVVLWNILFGFDFRLMDKHTFEAFKEGTWLDSDGEPMKDAYGARLTGKGLDPRLLAKFQAMQNVNCENPRKDHETMKIMREEVDLNSFLEFDTTFRV